MGGKNKTVVGLDIGTSRTSVLVAEMTGDDGIRILGVGTHHSDGVRKGEVINIDKTVRSIEKAVAQAERISGVEIRSVFAGIRGGEIRTFESRSLLPVAKPAAGVTPRDVEKAITAAQAIALPSDFEVIHVIPQQFAVDNQKGVANPEGMLGTRLEALVLIITGAVSSIQNMIKSINQAGVEVEDIIFQPLASSMAVLRQEEQKSGVLLLDLGGGTTDYILFQDDIIRATGVLKVGGDHVTNDISIGLNLLQNQAEEVKKKHGSALAGRVDENETFSLPAVMGRAETSISRRKLGQIIQLRMSEIFSMVKKELEEKGLFHGLGSGVIITGGSSLLKNVDALVEEIFRMPVRRGNPWGVSGLREIIDSPVYAAAVGLVKYGFQHRAEEKGGRKKGGGKFSRPAKNLKGWLEKYF